MERYSYASKPLNHGISMDFSYETVVFVMNENSCEIDKLAMAKCFLSFWRISPVDLKEFGATY